MSYDGFLAATVGPAHPPPLAGTASVPHAPAKEIEPPAPRPARAHPRTGGPPARGGGGTALASPPPAPRGAGDPEPAAPFLIDTAALDDALDACLAPPGGGGGALTGAVTAHAKAWLARERVARPPGRAPGRAGWRASAAAVGPALRALLQAAAGAGAAGPLPAGALAAWAAASKAARAALAAEEAEEGRAEGGVGL